MMDHVKVGRLGPFPKVSKPVFIASALLIVGFIIFGVFFTEMAGTLFSFLQGIITNYFGWFFVVLVNVALILCVYIAMSRYGDIRLGA